MIWTRFSREGGGTRQLPGGRVVTGSAAALVAGVLLAACGGTATAAKATQSPASKSSSSAAAFSGAVGKVAAVSGPDFTVAQVKGGSVAVDTTTKTLFTQEVTMVAAALAVGQCARASGSTNSIGVVAATTLTISTPTSSGCTVSFGGFSGTHRKFPSAGGSARPPFPGASGSARPPFPGAGAPGAAAFRGAFGKIAQVTTGSQGTMTLEVQGASGQTGVTVSSTTKIVRDTSASLRAVTAGECAVAIGAKAKTGVVTAQSVSLSTPGPAGCTAGAGGFGGGFGAGAPTGSASGG